MMHNTSREATYRNPISKISLSHDQILLWDFLVSFKILNSSVNRNIPDEGVRGIRSSELIWLGFSSCVMKSGIQRESNPSYLFWLHICTYQFSSVTNYSKAVLCGPVCWLCQTRLSGPKIPPSLLDFASCCRVRIEHQKKKK